MHYEVNAPTARIRERDARLPYFNYRQDGKNIICILSDDAFFRKVWFRDRKVLQVQTPEGVGQDFYLIKSRTAQGRCICPNCGNEDNIEKMLDGCDYCGTQFHIEDFKGKVSSYYMEKKGIALTRDRNPVKIIGPLVFFLMAGLFIMFE